MDTKLHLLDSSSARGTDGGMYKVCAYEHLARDESIVADGLDHWEPTGLLEYRLADGERLEVERDGTLKATGSGREFRRQ